MNFRKNYRADEPEINFIPLIDVLLVILIFLFVTTTFSQQNALKVNLPSSAKQEQKDDKKPSILAVTVNADGVYAINQKVLENNDISSLSYQLKMEAEAFGADQPTIVISADARSSHQQVINILEAARLAKLSKISFLTQAAR
jgi:biopolymer transport protein ExbD